MNSLEEKKETFLRWIGESNHIVFFGGAGVSTESGIPDFRSVDGLYHQKYDYPPETILSHSFFRSHTEEFYKFYRDKMLCLDAQPNVTHKALAKLEEQGKLKAVVTQNIDGLHQKAGSKKVLELHGSVLRNYCERCHQFYGVDTVANSTGIPRCQCKTGEKVCNGTIKPDVVLYEEGLDDGVISESIHEIQSADMLIVGGTSLTVYPAAGLLRYYHGHKLVLINKSATSMDHQADLVLQCGLGEVFQMLD